MFVHTDHSAIRYLMNKPILNGRIFRWLLLLQEFDVQIVDKPGKKNVVVDFLSRASHQVEDEFVDNYFPYEYFFSFKIQTPWFGYITNYLAAGKLLNHFTSKEKSRIIRKISSFS